MTTTPEPTYCPLCENEGHTIATCPTARRIKRSEKAAEKESSR